MSRLVAYIFIYFSLSSALAEPACGPYFPLSHPRLPEKVRQAADAVFAIRSADGDQFETLNESDYQGPRGGLFEYNFDTWQTEFCRQFLPEFCLYSRGQSIGSAFLFQDQQTLVTALHNLSGYLTAALRRGGYLNKPLQEQVAYLKSIKIPIYLTKKITDPWMLGGSLVDYVEIKEMFLQHSVQEYQALKRAYSFPHDIDQWEAGDLVVLKTNVKINARPIQLSNLSPEESGVVYAVGFPSADPGQVNPPGCTSYYADGITQYASVGEVIPVVGRAGRQIISTTILARRGVSGGPLLDLEGNALGAYVFTSSGKGLSAPLK